MIRVRAPGDVRSRSLSEGKPTERVHRLECLDRAVLGDHAYDATGEAVLFLFAEDTLVGFGRHPSFAVKLELAPTTVRVADLGKVFTR